MNLRTASLVLVATCIASRAHAPSISADPTLIFSTTPDEHIGEAFEGGLYLGAVGRTPKFGPQLTLKAHLIGARDGDGQGGFPHRPTLSLPELR